jgi:hypothetical protein
MPGEGSNEFLVLSTYSSSVKLMHARKPAVRPEIKFYHRTAGGVVSTHAARVDLGVKWLEYLRETRRFD